MNMLQALPDLATFIFIASLKSTLLVGLVLLIQRVAARLLSAGARHLLWLSVIVSLVTPVGFDSALPAVVMPDFSAVLPAALPADTALPVSARVTIGTNPSPQQTAISLPAQSVQTEPRVMTDPPFSWQTLLSCL